MKLIAWAAFAAILFGVIAPLRAIEALGGWAETHAGRLCTKLLDREFWFERYLSAPVPPEGQP